ncbi:MAG: formate/nitrite transporter family protein, partial [Coriobacteriales bacterium]|nr:formate/nitrite transporter family protein [Coriobacteriales bacterium]
FTGDCLMIMGCVHGKFSALKMIKVLIIVYLANFVGSILFAELVNQSGQYSYTNGLLGAFTIKVAMGKVNLSFGAAIASGILCNIFVCMAVLMAMAAKDIAGKVWAIFFPILAFIVSGYEHCVANMFFLPYGLMLSGGSAVTMGAICGNILVVTLGNMVGGALLLGGAYWLAFGRNDA